jgi:hypothetical protein
MQTCEQTTTQTTTRPVIWSADGESLCLGLEVWMTWGGHDRATGALRVVQGRIERISRHGRVTLRGRDGRRHQGAAVGVYVKDRPAVQRITTAGHLLSHLRDLQPCPQCECLCDRGDFVRELWEPGRYATYFYCAHCLLGVKTLWDYADGEWRRGFESRLTPGRNAKAFHTFQAQMAEAREKARRHKGR